MVAVLDGDLTLSSHADGTAGQFREPDVKRNSAWREGNCGEGADVHKVECSPGEVIEYEVFDYNNQKGDQEVMQLDGPDADCFTG